MTGGAGCWMRSRRPSRPCLTPGPIGSVATAIRWALARRLSLGVSCRPSGRVSLHVERPLSRRCLPTSRMSTRPLPGSSRPIEKPCGRITCGTRRPRTRRGAAAAASRSSTAACTRRGAVWRDFFKTLEQLHRGVFGNIPLQGVAVSLTPYGRSAGGARHPIFRPAVTRAALFSACAGQHISAPSVERTDRDRTPPMRRLIDASKPWHGLLVLVWVWLVICSVMAATGVM